MADAAEQLPEHFMLGPDQLLRLRNMPPAMRGLDCTKTSLRADLSADKAVLPATLTMPTSTLTLAYAVADLPSTEVDVRNCLAREDVDDLHAGRIGPSHRRAFVRSRLGLLHEPDPMTTTTTEAA